MAFSRCAAPSDAEGEHTEGAGAVRVQQRGFGAAKAGETGFVAGAAAQAVVVPDGSYLAAVGMESMKSGKR